MFVVLNESGHFFFQASLPSLTTYGNMEDNYISKGVLHPGIVIPM